MAKKYKLKDEQIPRKPSFLGLDYSDWAKLNSGEAVELDKLPELAKDYLEEIKANLKEKLTPSKEAGYYPHYHRVLLIDYMNGLMPKLQEVQNKLTGTLKSDKKGINEAIKEIHGYVNKHGAIVKVEIKMGDIE